jgi:hypothetical protein
MVWRRTFSTRRNFLATHLRQRLGFRELPCLQRALVIGVVSPALVTAPVLGVGPSLDRILLEVAAGVVAIRLTMVVGATDEEPAGAVPTGQREDYELVHPGGGTKTGQSLQDPARYLRTGCPSASCTRGSRLSPGPSFVSSAQPAYRVGSSRATSRPPRPMPGWGPGPGDAGGSGAPRGRWRHQAARRPA